MAIDPNIKKKADDIRNKIYGKEVRESLASGLEEMSSDVVENEGRQSVVEGRQDSVESQWQAVSAEMTDKDVISAPEIIAARGGEANLKARLDKEHQDVTAQLAQIVVYAKNVGIKGDGLTDDSQAIVNASQDNVTLVFTDGTYVIDSHVLIENVSNLKWIAKDNVIFYDKGKEITTLNGVQRAPHGICFQNCPNLYLNKTKHDGDAWGGGQVELTNHTDRVPQIDIVDCPNVKVDGLETLGFVGPYTRYPVDYPNKAENLMRGSYLRFLRCQNAEVVNCGIAPGSSRGEFFSFYECHGLSWKNGYHFQGSAENTFWSFGKVINSDDVEIDGHKIQSISSGSLIDVSGSNVRYKNMYVDYPNGKLIDITGEWDSQYDSENIVVENLSTNGTGVTSQLSPEIPFDEAPSQKNIQVNNLNVINNVPNASIIGAQIVNFEDMTISNSTFKNIRNVIWGHRTNRSNRSKKFLLEKSTIITDLKTLSGWVQIDTDGDGSVIDNCYIDLKGLNILKLFDMRAVANETTDLTHTTDKLTIQNTTIKNCIIHLEANIDFKNVKFENVHFYSFGTGAHSNPTITFDENCELVLVDDNEINTTPFGMFSGKVIFSGAISGRSRHVGGLISESMLASVNIVFSGMKKLDVVRVNSDNTTQESIIISYNNDTTEMDVTIKNSVVGENTEFIRTAGVNVDSPQTFANLKVRNTEFKRGSGLNMYSGVNRLNLLLQNSILTQSTLTNIEGRTFNDFKHVGNIGI